eukprot:m.312185 g.312185  ORF g.312185 m.312185 type:complete len:51 (-) comp19657_c1_seq7:485-637(-)
MCMCVCVCLCVCVCVHAHVFASLSKLSDGAQVVPGLYRTAPFPRAGVHFS